MVIKRYLFDRTLKSLNLDESSILEQQPKTARRKSPVVIRKCVYGKCKRSCHDQPGARFQNPPNVCKHLRWIVDVLENLGTHARAKPIPRPHFTSDRIRPISEIRRHVKYDIDKRPRLKINTDPFHVGELEVRPQVSPPPRGAAARANLHYGTGKTLAVIKHKLGHRPPYGSLFRQPVHLSVINSPK